MSEEVSKLVWQEAERLLVRQEADLDTLHARALALFSAATLTAGLFLGRLPDHRSGLSNVSLIVGLAAFVGMLGTTLWLAKPNKFAFSHRLDDWIADIGEGKTLPVLEWTHNVARDLNENRIANQAKIRRLYKGFRVALVLMATQVAAWVLAVL